MFNVFVNKTRKITTVVFYQPTNILFFITVPLMKVTSHFMTNLFIYLTENQEIEKVHLHLVASVRLHH